MTVTKSQSAIRQFAWRMRGGPKPKPQVKTNFRSFKFFYDAWNLDIGNCLGFGAWKLGFKIFTLLIVTTPLVLSLLAAEDIRISGANRAEYWLFVDDRLDTTNLKDHITDKLKLSLDYKDITLRGVFFLWDPSLRGTGKLQYFDYTAMYKKDPVNILYGRYYATFGRGLCLNQFLDEDFNLDNSLYGLKADLKFFRSQLTMLMGKPRNIFFEELKYIVKNDTTDQIRGANLETRLLNIKNSFGMNTVFGGRYVRINKQTDLTPKAFTELFGGSAGVIVGPWENYFEYGRHWGTEPVIGGRLRGDGYLYTTGLALPGFGISFQYVDYKNIGFGGQLCRYNEPPTPIKSGISVNRGLDEIGFGVSVVASPLDFISIEMDNNKVTTRDEELSKLEQVFKMNEDMDGVLEQMAKVITHPTMESEATFAVEHVKKQGIEPPVEIKTETKPYVDLQYEFGAFFVEAGYEHAFIKSDTSEYNDRAVSLSIGRPEMFVFSVRFERRNRVPEWLVAKLGEETFWPMYELTLDLTTKHNLRIRVGGEKGGLICSGGVCRFEQPFRGVKLVLTSIF
jgi:hypothetical protein